LISFHIRARHPQGHQEAEAVPDGRRPQGGLPGQSGRLEEMDDAHPELEGGVEPVYDRVRGPPGGVPVINGQLQRII